ncbi:integral peroxisomal membrane peroxin-domain-containing protein [Jimgerdemannia flammicorona]|uniref:Integral peroxisomal membrane peroxin-domain-containing protein n=1 Tax=Jimgerdemannia flammicorona TaxID=994334 RepID=A0A433QHN3_9FUNG|nr:integral peroxisomal membrane peroxin-domain-containing protein [Jimgerdemannia flammicorona]
MSSFDAQSFYLAGLVPNNYMQPRTNSITAPDSTAKLPSQPIDFVYSIPPSVTRLLTYCTPAIHFLFYLLKLTTWQTRNASESVLFLAAWWLVCLWLREILVYGTTWALVTWMAWTWIQRSKRERLGKPMPAPSATSSADLNRALAELEVIVDHVGVFHRALAALLARLDWSDPAETHLILNVALYTYLPWLLLSYLVPLRCMILAAGSLLICWSSPWMRVIRLAIARSPVMRYLGEITLGAIISLGAPRTWRALPTRQFSVRAFIQRAREEQRRMMGGGGGRRSTWGFQTGDGKQEEANKSATTTVPKVKETDLIFRFVMYENQRWWLGLDWTNNLLPSERLPWTDEYGEPTPSKSRFTLPPLTHTTTPHPTDPTLQIRKTMAWSWADPDWWLDVEGDVDKEGWEYGQGGWKQFSSKTGVNAFVRRRKWVRAARLEEREEEISTEVTQEVENLVVEKSESTKGGGENKDESDRGVMFHEEPESQENGSAWTSAAKIRDEGYLKRRETRKATVS